MASNKTSHRSRLSRHAVKSSRVHLSKSRTPFLHPSTFAGKVVLVVILLAFFAVIAATISSIFSSPERMVKSRLDSLASDYYEKYYYEHLSNSEHFKSGDNLDAIMDKYVKAGFSPVTLRELTLQNPSLSKSEIEYVLKYCDEDATRVTIYPESPFKRTSYHTEFTYACTF